MSLRAQRSSPLYFFCLRVSLKAKSKRWIATSHSRRYTTREGNHCLIIKALAAYVIARWLWPPKQSRDTYANAGQFVPRLFRRPKGSAQ
ncbi:hypothetical protein DFAR_1180004 [Desulfarculales bacterium]